ncbi:MAG: TonB-dependent receptor, partial [Saprospiraceae bacterium]|nr:TonB-dependent receptor [Saprospiraceae bacterium]
IIISFFIVIPALISQNKHTLSGYIKEKGSGELLIGVNIYLPDLKTGTVSNNYGFYSITVPNGNYKFIFSYVGYKAVIKELDLSKDIELNIQLESSLDLEGVEISAQKQEKISEVVQMSIIDLPVDQVKNIPALFGEKDVFKALQLMPGIQSGTEGSSGIYVRGGGPDQNLIILDDATVYNANHLFGFFSVFNGDALKSIELTKGGFPARYGGRLSSVIEMNMKDGNKEKFSGEAGIGIISSRLTLEGPIVKDKASFLVSARRTYIDVLLQPFMNLENGKGGYYFYDLNAKVNYDFGRKNKLYLSGYFGRDKFYIKQKDSYGEMNAGLFWQNQTATARWNHLFNNKLFANTSLIYSKYKLQIYDEEIDSDDDYFKLKYYSGIQDISLKYDLQYHPNPDHIIRMGIISTRHVFTPSAVVIDAPSLDEFESNAKKIESMESGIYVEDEFKIKTKLKINAGFRLSHFINKKEHYINPEPRFSASYKLAEDISMKASYAIMNQYIHLLSNTGIGLPTDLWVPSTDNIKPQQSQQVALGFAKDFTGKNLSLSLEGYYKKMDDIIGYKEGASFLYIEDPTSTQEFSWEDNITSGQGWSYGAEILLQRKYGKFSGWIGYTLSWTQLQFDELNFGEKYYARYDRRHDISVVEVYKINEKFTLSGTWVYGTGNAITLPQATFSAVTHNGHDYNKFGGDYFQSTTDYGEKNGSRMAPYHRMDIGIQYHKKIKKFTHTFEFSVYNLYNRQNPFFYYIDDDTIRTELKQVSIFPILPSLTYSLKF